MNNVVNLKLKRIEKQYKDFYKQGGVNLKLDIVYRDELHKLRIHKKLNGSTLTSINRNLG